MHIMMIIYLKEALTFIKIGKSKELQNIGDAKITTSASSVKIVKLSKNSSFTVFDTIYVTETYLIECGFLLDETMLQ